MSETKPKKIKYPEIIVDEQTFLRIPIKTHVVLKNDILIDVINQYAKDSLMSNDILFVSEKIVAITQGRAIPLDEIHPRPLAKLLSHYVTKTPAGIGLGMPETMEMALQECGTPRILYASAASAITKLMGKKGRFYEIAGYRAQSIDGPTPNTLPPYNKHVVLGPDRPDEVAKEVSAALGGIRIAIVDINDLNGVILGASHSDMNRDLLVRILKDNPLGQDHEQTPLGIIRKV